MKDRRKIIVWLSTLCLLITCTVVVGGATRLTNSGLSITEWKPIMGAIPPLNEEDWLMAFERYKKIPEYHIEHSHLGLSGFKKIFLWEYAHRNLGRLIGIVFLIPFIFFLIRRSLSKRMIQRLIFGFSLGALQGAIGWFMVQSGLGERPDVSHYRLSAHLILAFFIFSRFLLILQDLSVPSLPAFKGQTRVRIVSGIFHSFLGLQIIYGAFVAGLRAGYYYPTFPLMNDVLLPGDAFLKSPGWSNYFENPIMVQFIHRWLGVALTLAAPVLYLWCCQFELGKARRVCLQFFMYIMVFQTGLGILTLMSGMSISLALAHQTGALAVFGTYQVFSHTLKGSRA